MAAASAGSTGLSRYHRIESANGSNSVARNSRSSAARRCGCAGDSSCRPLSAFRILPIPAVNTDSQGKFSLKDVEPGSYTLQVASNGFARAEYGQRMVGVPGRPVTLTADQTLKTLSSNLRRRIRGAVECRILQASPLLAFRYSSSKRLME